MGLVAQQLCAPRVTVINGWPCGDCKLLAPPPYAFQLILIKFVISFIYSGVLNFSVVIIRFGTWSLESSLFACFSSFRGNL